MAIYHFASFQIPLILCWQPSLTEVTIVTECKGHHHHQTEVSATPNLEADLGSEEAKASHSGIYNCLFRRHLLVQEKYTEQHV